MRRPAGGFTLIEMMVTIVVLALMLTVGLPAWQTFVQNERLNAVRDNMISALGQARGTAVNDDSVVTVCPYSSASGGSCGNSWSAGWIIIETQGSSSTVLAQQPLSYTGAPTIGSLATGSASGTIASISFNPRPPYVAAAQTGDFRICDNRGANYALSFNLQTTGYAQAAASTGYTLAGAALSCP
ncbi:GspH/FimT family pseudopilin [Chromobacterium sp. CV08]|uniref:GspH/FimT family pseudopilin n=1 Tax=Chromobacterium sp. CV08 TaxID=3133274 RepID=UPI003DA9FBAC